MTAALSGKSNQQNNTYAIGAVAPNGNPPIAPGLDRLNVKVQEFVKAQKKATDSDSDGEIEDHKKLVVFRKQEHVPAASMTISCRDTNIKGSTLIKIVHDIIQNWYDEAINLACEYEKDIGGTQIPAPEEKEGVLMIQAPRDWFMALGGWKGMMPSKEVKDYFFNQLKGKKFTGVNIYNSGVIFSINNHRLLLPKGFSINNVNITEGWQKRQQKYVPIVKTDLSYPQIVKAIITIKKGFNLEDYQIANLQLRLLSGEGESLAWFQQIPKTNQNEILQFLHFLNGLMFGIEASGLNGALATGLMTLDMIADKQFDYASAFNANEDGGIYPYACFGNNKGTYAAREQILLHQDVAPRSMKDFRENTSLSPVAVKEAILIKEWLKCNGVIMQNGSHSEQIHMITRAIQDLVANYYSPWLVRNYLVKKFQKANT